VTTQPHYKITLRLDEMTTLGPNEQGYKRVDASTLADLELVGATPESVLRQAHQHVGLLVAANAPIEVSAR
jgi:hypothetical protein